MAPRNFQFYFTKLEVLVEAFMATGSGNKTAFNKTELRETGTANTTVGNMKHVDALQILICQAYF